MYEHMYFTFKHARKLLFSSSQAAPAAAVTAAMPLLPVTQKPKQLITVVQPAPPPPPLPVKPAVAKPSVRIFVALFDYDPPTMSPNPDACDEELPFREGQLIKVRTKVQNRVARWNVFKPKIQIWVNFWRAME
jgi:hypothetical protein